MENSALGINTKSSLPFRSPFEKAPVEGLSPILGLTESLDLGGRVGLARLDEVGLLEIRGQVAAAALTDADEGESPAVGVAHTPGDALLARLRPDLWTMVTASRHSSPPWVETLMPTVHQGAVTLTDVTHGRACLLLCGDPAAEVLARLCALDLTNVGFPHATATQTALAKVKALVIRWDWSNLGTYFIAVDRSLGRYVMNALLAELNDFDPVGLVAEGAWPATSSADAR